MIFFIMIKWGWTKTYFILTWNNFSPNLQHLIYYIVYFDEPGFNYTGPSITTGKNPLVSAIVKFCGFCVDNWRIFYVGLIVITQCNWYTSQDKSIKSPPVQHLINTGCKLHVWMPVWYIEVILTFLQCDAIRWEQFLRRWRIGQC